MSLPKHLHRDLACQAAHDQVSLNTLIVALPERGMGARPPGLLYSVYSAREATPATKKGLRPCSMR